MRDALDAVLEPGEGATATRRVVAKRPSRRRVIGLAVALGLMAVVAVWSVWLRGGQTNVSGRGASANRLAVLPMGNLSTSPDDRYFADGMTEELISTLSRIGGVRVIARSSVLGYAGTKKTAAEIGRELGVGNIVEGTCQKIGNQLRITVRLVDAATNEPRWNDSYDREATLANILAIQREIATTVAQRLSVRMLAADSQRVARQPTNNLEAYGLYVRANLLRHDNANRPTLRAALDTATEMLQRAIALDSSFAEAHAALAQTYIARLFNFEPNSALHARAAAEIAKALAIDPALAEAYYARGDLAFTRESGWQLEEAMRDYRHALALKPNGADIHAAYGTLLFHVGLLDSARRELETTVTLDPANQFVLPRIARVMWYAGQYDSALVRMNRGLGFPEEHALVLGYVGRAADGLASLDTAQVSQRTRSDTHAARAVLFARLDKRAEAEGELRSAIPTGPTASHFHHAEFMIASAYSLLGNGAEALRWLERMADDGMPNYALLVNDPSLADARSASAFQAFLVRERARNDRLRAIITEPTASPSRER
jgi:TolB-like protein/Tfp pilus assembly protein PilF